MRLTQSQVDAYNARRSPKAAASNDACADERKLHEEIEKECVRRRWYYVHSRMDMATTTKKGVPDFIIAIPCGVTLWIECKAKNRKLSQEQYTTMHVLKVLGHFHEVIYSFEDFIKFVSSYAEISAPGDNSCREPSDIQRRVKIFKKLV